MTTLIRSLRNYLASTKIARKYVWTPAVHEADHDTVDALNGKNWG